MFQHDWIVGYIGHDHLGLDFGARDGLDVVLGRTAGLEIDFQAAPLREQGSLVQI